MIPDALGILPAMRIIVCIKRVVDTETRVRVAADGTSIDLNGVQFITAPYDEMAVEKALRLRDEAGVSFLIVTHDDEVAATADRVVRMKDGEIVE